MRRLSKSDRWGCAYRFRPTYPERKALFFPLSTALPTNFTWGLRLPIPAEERGSDRDAGPELQPGPD
jgi:hypothetical protein